MNDDHNAVPIIGHRTEQRDLDRAGRSTSIRPEAATRFNTTTQLQQDPSLIVPETGRINASGYAIPRLRGQDSRLTEIYFDDILLQDPFTGLPLVDDLDLRAFGELRLHHGVSPYDLPTLSPIGAMEYRLTPLLTAATSDAAKSHSQDLAIGSSLGEPYGHSIWSLLNGQTGGEKFRVGYRLYGRSHETRGRFAYYDDNATPYNKTDDTTRIRTNNDRRSQQFLPILVIERGAHRLRLLGFINQADTAIPAPSSSQVSQARTTGRSDLIALNWLAQLANEHDSSPFWFPQSIATSLIQHTDRRRITDPTQVILGNEDQGVFQVRTQRAAVAPRFEGSHGSLLISLESADAKITTESGGDRKSNLRRRTQTLTTGGLWRPLSGSNHESLSLEGKTNWLSIQDDINERFAGDVFDVDSADTSRQLATRSHSLALGWQQENWQVYMQGALGKRAPTLLEEYGDGTTARANPRLIPETIRHKEFGGHLALTPTFIESWELRTALFQDDTDDKISFLPSLGQTIRAQNISRTRLRGAEASMTLGIVQTKLAQTDLMLAYTRLWPDDLSMPRTKLLPSTPEHSATAQISQRYSCATLRWLRRYRSQTYRDQQNAIVTPAYIIDDAAIDLISLADSQRAQLLNWQLGLSINNVFNKTHFGVNAPDTAANRGETAYGDIAGSPLPGRQWTAHVVLNF